MLGEAGRAGFAFLKRDGVWLALGDPAGDPRDCISAIWRFRDICDRAGVQPAFWRVGPALLLPTGSMTADGRAAVRWLLAAPTEGGCGLSGIIKWDDSAGRVVMCKGWVSAADKLDRAAAEQSIESILWSAWGKNTVRAAQAFDLEAKVVALVKKAAKDAGMTPGEIEAHVKAATAKGLLALKAA